jgi:nucleoside-diphosphate-sugar epimerase
MERILITGSEGFIGRHLTVKLLAEGYEVYGISLPPASGIDHPNYRWTSVDILDREKLSLFFRNSRFDTVIHLAALTTHEELTKHKERTLRINLEGTLNLLEEFKSTESGKFIFASTGKVYGRIQELPLSEDHPTSPINVLGKTKLIAEKLIDFFSGESAQQYVILRMFNVYGPGQRDYFLIPTILSQLRDGNGQITLGNLSHRRDYIFIEDVVDAILTVLGKEMSGNLNVFNVGSGRAHSASDIVKIMERILARKVSIKVDESRLRKDEFPEEYADVGKLLSLGWSPRYDLEAGIERTASRFLVEK